MPEPTTNPSAQPQQGEVAGLAEAAEILGVRVQNVRKMLVRWQVRAQELTMGPVYYRAAIERVRAARAGGARGPVPEVPDVVGLAEAAEILRVRAHPDTVRPRLADIPCEELAAGPTWRVADVERIAREASA